MIGGWVADTIAGRFNAILGSALLYSVGQYESYLERIHVMGTDKNMSDCTFFPKTTPFQTFIESYTILNQILGVS